MSSIVLLDTVVVGGFLSPDQKKSSEWNTFVQEMVSVVPNASIVIPIPVWYELAQWHKDWHKRIKAEIAKGTSRDPIFQYAHTHISNEILMDASCYLLHTKKEEKPDNVQRVKNKISFIDATIAAYSLRFNHYILTLNQQDFPIKFFDTVKIELSPHKSQRELACLLKPKQTEWQACKAII